MSKTSGEFKKEYYFLKDYHLCIKVYKTSQVPTVDVQTSPDFVSFPQRCGIADGLTRGAGAIVLILNLLSRQKSFVDIGL